MTLALMIYVLVMYKGCAIAICNVLTEMLVGIILSCYGVF